MRRLTIGQQFEAHTWTDIHGVEVRVPAIDGIIHLQFRRFAGCPICHRHLQSFVRREAELTAHGIREVIFFHSPHESLLKQVSSLPFAVIADPERKWYALFGVERSLWALLHPRAWWAGLRGLFAHGAVLPATGGPLGLPADVLIDAQGRIVDVHYGTHADDQWSVEGVLSRASSVATCEMPAAIKGASAPA